MSERTTPTPSVILIPLLVVLAITIASLPGRAQTPATDQQSTTRLLPVSGVLTDGNGKVRTGPTVVTFGLYDSQENGTLLWTEVQEVQADERGRYSAYLGAVSPVPQEVFSNEQARWLSVDVDGRQLPRMMLVAVPYALRAADAETLGGKPLSSFVTTGPDGKMRTSAGAVADPLIDGSGTPGQLAKFTTATDVGNSIITETPTNRIGIGTTDPTEGGAIDSKVTIRGSDGGTALAIANQSGVPRFALNVNSDGSWITYDRATGSFLPGIAQRGGRVGVSTTDPTGAGVVDSKFTVRNLDNNTGIAVLNESNARRFALNTLSTGAWLAYDGGGSTWNPGLSQLSGLVGIGTASPENTLHLASTGAAPTPVLKIDGAVNTPGEGASLRWTEIFGTDYGFEAFLDSDLNVLNFRAIENDVVTGDNMLVLQRLAPNNVGIGTAAPADKLHVAGDIRVGTGTTGCVRDADATVLAGTCSSDRRFKKNITPFSRALDNVARLQPVHFHWRADEYANRHFGTSESFGLIAQDVEKVLPELVTSDEQGYKAVRYSALPMHMLQAIKDLKTENDALKRRLDLLEETLLRLDGRKSK